MVRLNFQPYLFTLHLVTLYIFQCAFVVYMPLTVLSCARYYKYMNDTGMLSLRVVAGRLGVCTTTVRRLARSGKIRAFRVGNRIKIYPEYVTEYLERNIIRE